MADFVVIEKSEIPARDGRRTEPGPLVKALIAGQAVFIAPAAKGMSVAGGTRRALKPLGLVPRTRQMTRDGVEGVAIFATTAASE